MKLLFMFTFSCINFHALLANIYRLESHEIPDECKVKQPRQTMATSCVLRCRNQGMNSVFKNEACFCVKKGCNTTKTTRDADLMYVPVKEVSRHIENNDAFYLKREHLVQRNTLLTVLPILKKSWRLSFDLMLLAGVGGWKNIIHATIGGNYDKNGDRTPAMFRYGNLATRLHMPRDFLSPIYQDLSETPLYSYTNITVQQVRVGASYYFECYVNGTKEMYQKNDEAEEYKNVTLYASDDFYPAEDAKIRNLVFKNLE